MKKAIMNLPLSVICSMIFTHAIQARKSAQSCGQRAMPENILSLIHISLSKGKQKQFALAVALCRRPKLLLMDEPTANLDPLVRQEVLDLLAEEMEQEGVSVFFSTHITSDLDKIADYLIFLHGGELLLEGEKDRLIDTRRMVKGRRELLTQQARALLRGVEESDFGFRGLCEDEAAAFALFGNEAVYEKPTIEDLFMAYARGKGAAHHV